MKERSVDIRHLECFEEAARALHFTKAAATLGISQPTFSATIQQLERELGLPLFDRIGRRIQLTAAGRAFHVQTAHILNDLRCARQSVADVAGLAGGVVRLGVMHTAAASLLPEVLTTFHRAHPQVRIEVEKLSSREVQERLLEGSVDLGIEAAPVEVPELFAQPLFDDPVVMIVAKSTALPRRHRDNQITLGELAGVPLALTTPEFATRALLDATAAQQGVKLDLRLECNDIGLILSVVRKSELATVMPRDVARHQRDLIAIPIVKPALRRKASLLWHRDRYRSAAVRAMAELIARVAVRGD